MLVLTRRIGESITIDSKTVVTVLGASTRRGGGCIIRLGFNAPRDVIIVRNELLEHGADEITDGTDDSGSTVVELEVVCNKDGIESSVNVSRT